MAVGDTKSLIVSVAAVGTYDIKPPAGEEWVIHNILYNGGPIEFWKTDGANPLKFDTDNSAGGRLGMAFHATNDAWYQLKNTSAGAVIVSYDGIQTK